MISQWIHVSVPTISPIVCFLCYVFRMICRVLQEFSYDVLKLFSCDCPMLFLCLPYMFVSTVFPWLSYNCLELFRRIANELRQFSNCSLPLFLIKQGSYQASLRQFQAAQGRARKKARKAIPKQLGRGPP